MGSAPSVDVNIAPAVISDGSLTSTNSVLLAYAAATGPTQPVTVRSAAAAVAAGVPVAVAQQVADLITGGVPQIVLTRTNTAVASAATVDADGWGEAFELLDTVNYPLGQVMIPGIGTAAAHEALVAHSQTSRRCAFLDAPVDATAQAIVDLVELQSDSPDTYLTGMFADWAVVRAGGSATRQIPGSISAAGPTARMDVKAGHSNAMPAGPQETGTAGLVSGGLDVVQKRSIADLNLFADHGITPMRRIPTGVFVWDFLSITDDELWTNLASAQGVASPRSQLNWGRLGMQIIGDAQVGLRQFLFQQNDGEGQLLNRAESFLGANLAELWSKKAIYGRTADDSYTAAVTGITTSEDVASGTLRAAISYAPTPSVRHVVMQATVNR
ncbi:MAG: hypothetical protein EOP01_03485, partial [Propionibacteriaceae bacterium]